MSVFQVYPYPKIFCWYMKGIYCRSPLHQHAEKFHQVMKKYFTQFKNKWVWENFRVEYYTSALFVGDYRELFGYYLDSLLSDHLLWNVLFHYLMSIFLWNPLAVITVSQRDFYDVVLFHKMMHDVSVQALLKTNKCFIRLHPLKQTRGGSRGKFRGGLAPAEIGFAPEIAQYFSI